MPLALPILSTFDPPTSSEGTLDPLGLYQIADQLATRLVPAVRERMQRIRFLTAMAVGAMVSEGLDSDPEQPESPPLLVWEWLVVEALVRSDTDGELRGVPGTLVTRRAIKSPGYLDARSYLKNSRIFGFHGVYKRLAIHLGLVDLDFRPSGECERLVDAWARDLGYDGRPGVQVLLEKWREAVRRGVSRSPCCTRPGWNGDDWNELATSLLPHAAGQCERKALRELLHSDNERALGALPVIWSLQGEFDDDDYNERALHVKLRETQPLLGPLLDAIAAYEDFCRGIEDAFDLIRATSGGKDAHGFEIVSIGNDDDFVASVDKIDSRYERARTLLWDFDSQIALLFDDRFSRFAVPMSAEDVAIALCLHHEEVQQGKSDQGKRAWFDRVGADRIYMRQSYRETRREILPGEYVHSYRGRPIRNFYSDL